MIPCKMVYYILDIEWSEKCDDFRFWGMYWFYNDVFFSVFIFSGKTSSLVSKYHSTKKFGSYTP